MKKSVTTITVIVIFFVVVICFFIKNSRNESYNQLSTQNRNCIYVRSIDKCPEGSKYTGKQQILPNGKQYQCCYSSCTTTTVPGGKNKYECPAGEYKQPSYCHPINDSSKEICELKCCK